MAVAGDGQGIGPGHSGRPEVSEPGIDFVRPGPATQDWVRQTVAAAKLNDPLTPVTLIAPNHYAGRQMRWALAFRTGYVNVRSMLLTDIATRLSGGSARSARALTSLLEESAVRRAVHAAGGQLGPLAHQRALHKALLQLFRELRRQQTDVDQLLSEPHGQMAAAALQAYGVYRRLVEPFPDRTAVRLRATELLLAAADMPPELMELGTLLLFLPTRLDQADARLLAAAGRWVRLEAAFPWFGDHEDLGNALARAGAAHLRQAVADLRVTSELPRAHANPPALEHTRRSILEEANGVLTQNGRAELASMNGHAGDEPPRDPHFAVIRAPNAAEELREIVRWIGRDLEAHIPLHHVAILYRQTEAYGPLVRESLDLAGLPWSALDGRTLLESRPGRALLSLLDLPRKQFARAALLAWIEAAPTDQAGLGGSVWDRVSRAANVVRGATEWVSRLGDYAQRQHQAAVRLELEGNAPTARSRRREAGLAERMAVAVSELARLLRAPVDGAPWSEFVDWAATIWTAHCAGNRVWRVDEQPFADDVATALAGLKEADLLDGDSGASMATFIDTLEDVLEGRTRPVGHFGQGILVGPVQAVTGLVFDRVYIVGMNEGVFPPPPPADPFFPSATHDPLGARERHRRHERQSFLTAVAAADGGRLTLSVADALDGRRSFPSPWLLQLASQQGTRAPLFTTTFQALRQPPNADWLRVVVSSTDGAQNSSRWSDLEDRRLQEAVRTDLRRHAMAFRADLPLGVGLTTIDARSSTGFTAYDGNLSELALSTPRIRRLLDGTGITSASAIQTWATCPFQYFLGRILSVEPTHRPEDGWTISALERGGLVHRILEQFFKALRLHGRPTVSEGYTESDVKLLEEIAEQQLADLHARGATGHPLVWETTATAIRTDLRTFLVEDERWRREHRFEPRHIEQSFGMPSSDSWDVLEFDFIGGKLRFRGFIDRVDLDPNGRRAYVFDYKTGGSSGYKELADDPLMGGEHLQLALYKQSVHVAYPELEDIGAAFWFISSKGKFERLPRDESGIPTDQRLKAVLEGVVGGIGAGAFPQVPGAETERPGKKTWDNCAYCDYTRVCPSGRDAVWARKKDDPGYAFHAALTLANPEEQPQR